LRCTQAGVADYGEGEQGVEYHLRTTGLRSHFSCALLRRVAKNWRKKAKECDSTNDGQGEESWAATDRNVIPLSIKMAGSSMTSEK
jgi:hypothetical protein